MMFERKIEDVGKTIAVPRRDMSQSACKRERSRRKLRSPKRNVKSKRSVISRDGMVNILLYELYKEHETFGYHPWIVRFEEVVYRQLVLSKSWSKGGTTARNVENTP